LTIDALLVMIGDWQRLLIIGIGLGVKGLMDDS
jgi:hypothetical protein